MHAEILATGDEILDGALVDSNSAYIAQTLEEHGIAVKRHITVGDDMAILVTALQEIGSRAQVALVTGGLGPTQDDLSREAAARAAGVELVVDERALAEIEGFFNQRGRTMTESNRKQAYIPQGATCLYNPMGTAPGFAITVGQCRFFFMPGVPPEMHCMLDEQIIPQIMALQGEKRGFHLKGVVSSFGLPESAVGERVAKVSDLFPEIKLGLRAKFPEIQVKLYLNTLDESLGREILAEASRWVADQLGDHVFSFKENTMAAETGALLKTHKATLAVAESCTGGLVAHWLTNTPGSSDYFLFSGVTYANETKINVLDVSPDTLNRVGAVDEETAKEMAQGVRRLAGATYGLATTGIAGPGGGSKEKPVGTVCIGLAGPQVCLTKRVTVGYGRRLMNKQIFAMNTLNLLRRHLLGILAP